MALSMHTNYASLVTQNTLNGTGNMLNKAMERLATGYRINSAADDAAGLQIASRLEAQTRGMSVAQRNSQDGISMMQTAEGALDEVTNIAYRMNDLAIQSANGTNTQADRDALDAEYQELKNEITNILTNTNFGGENLLSTGGFGAAAVVLQIGSTTAETLSVDATAELGAVSGATYGDITTAATAQTEMTLIQDTILDQVGAARAKLGASINRLEHTITNLGNMVENTSASKGRITDADFAVETSNMTKNQMLMQAGTSVLSQTNQLSGMAMSLLR